MHTPNAERLLAPIVVSDRTSLSRTTLWRLTKKGQFPTPVQVSPGRVAWSESAVSAWIAAHLSSNCQG